MKKIFTFFLVISLILLSMLYGCGLQDNGGSSLDHSGDHIDTDGGGHCDLCGISVISVLDFYVINDLHGKLDDGDSHPGSDELTTYLQNASDGNAIIISVGDMWQGSAESNLTRGLIMTEWMNELGFVSMTIGNHEYDWGEEYILSNREMAQFPFLAINIYDRETDERVSYADSSVMVERGGVKIGIIGAIGDCYSSISAEMVEDVYFKTGYELTELVKEESDRLRSEGADIIIYSLHDGYNKNKNTTTDVTSSLLSSYYDPALSREGYVDLVFEAHTHMEYVLRDTYGIYHLQGGGDNEGITHVEVAVNYANDTSEVNVAEVVSSERYSALEDDPLIDRLLAKYEDDISIAYRELGTNSSYLDRDAARQLIAKLYCEAGENMWGDEYDIFLGGGYLSIRDPGYLGVGVVDYAMLMSLFPFDNNLTLCSIKGSDLLRRFVNTSNSNYFIHYTEYGENNKNSIDPNAIYYVIADTYSSSYAPNRLTVVETYTDGIYARDLLADYISAGGLEN